MVSLVVLFWMFVILFAIIGAMRGWAQELLVSFSVILALFIIIGPRTLCALRQRYPQRHAGKLSSGCETDYPGHHWCFLVTSPPIIPAWPRRTALRANGCRIFFSVSSWALLNGYLIAGSIWYFMDAARLSLPELIICPADGHVSWLRSPTI